MIVDQLKNYYRKLVYFKAGVAYIHVPKCGGTSVSTSLYGRRLGHLTYDEIRLISPNVALCTIIRDPIERFVSAYKFASVGASDGIYLGPKIETLEECLEYIKYTDEVELDPVFRTQSFYLGGILDDKNMGFIGILSSKNAMDYFREKYKIEVLNLNRSNCMNVELDGKFQEKISDLYKGDVVLFQQILDQGGFISGV